MKKIILIVILFTSFLSNSQSKLSGVITYYFNEYQGDKPDIGSKIYVIDSSRVNQQDLKILKLYLNTSKFQNELLKFKSNYEVESIAYTMAKTYDPKGADGYYIPRLKNIQSDIDDVKSHLQKFGFKEENEISYLDSKAKMIIENIKSNATITKTIDATGGYSCNLKPSTYFILIKSNNRQSLTSTENDGNLFFKGIKLKTNSEIDVSYNFNI
jgi:hypothetical protein